MLTQLPRRDWQHFFARVSAALAGRAVQVESAGLDEELPGEWIVLSSLSFDGGR
jgi:hypothetical protein